MKYHYDLSVIVPGIRPSSWDTIYQHIGYACKKYSWEVIFSSPNSLPESLSGKLNVKHIKHFGNPSRAFHLGTRMADGKIICIIADDAHLFNDSIDQSMDLLLSSDNARKNVVVLRYREGENYSAGEFPMAYWTAGYHGDTKQPGINPEWKLTLTPMMFLEYYNELGGIDLLYEHTNMNMLDLGFRVTKDGGKIFLSPKEVMNCNFEPNRTPENSAVISAYANNDRDRFYKMYSDHSRQVKIEENWRESDPVWKRRKY